MLKFKEFELHPLTDRVAAARTAPEMFPKADAAMIERHRHWLEDGFMEPGTDKLILAYRSWLVKLPDMTILFDLANGEDKPRPHRPDMDRMKSNWLVDMGRAGVSPDDIDLVLCSHLHLDHTGWMTRQVKGEWQPTFLGRRHLVSRTELEFWRANVGDYPFQGESLMDTVEPLLAAGLVDAVEEYHQITDGVSLFPLPGHSPGMFGMKIERGGETCVLAADLAHHPLQLHEPQLSTIFDTDPDESEATRRAFMEEYADTGALIVPIHFPKPAFQLKEVCGQVVPRFP